MPPKKAPAAPTLPVPRDIASAYPLDGCDGALGIDDMYVSERIRNVKTGLVDFVLSEACLQGSAILDLNDLSLDAIPAGLAALPWVQALTLTRNLLTNECVHSLSASSPHLKALDLCGNLLSHTLPPSVGKLGSGALEELFLDHNLIAGLPDEMGALSAMTWLTLRKNILTTLPGGALSGWASLLHLDLRENKLRSLPPEIGKCVALEELYLNNNELTELPGELGQCARLLELHVANNGLTALPPAIATCTALEVLDVSTNKISGALPGEPFLTLPNLLVFHCALNKIASLPTELGTGCPDLEILNCASTGVKSLPDSLCGCVRLREIYCNNTPMSILPVGIAAWTQLEAGLWRNCKLKALPPGVEDAWAGSLAILDVHAKGKKDTCKILEPVRDKLKNARIVGAVWQKPKKGKK